MCWQLRLFIVGLVLAMVSLFSSPMVLAQMPGIPGMGLGGMGRGRSGGHDQRRQQQQQQFEQQLRTLPALQTTGTVEAVTQGYIKVLSAANQSWVFQVLPTAKCQLTGKAKLEALGPGCYIRFVAPVNRHRNSVDEPLTKLLVFTPSQFRQVGAEPDVGFGSSFGERPGADKSEKKEEKPARPAFGAPAAAAGAGAERERGAGRKSGGASSGKSGTGTGGAKGGAPAEMFDVRGQLTQISGGKARLYCPNEHFRPNVRVEIAEDADIDVEIDDPMGYTLARKGDKIRVLGRQGMADRGYATDLEITLSEPLGAGQSAETKKGHGKAGRGKRGAEAEEPAAGEKKGEKKDAEAKKEKSKDKDADADKSKDKDKDADSADAPASKKTKAADPSGAKKSGTRKPAKKPAKDADEESAEEKDK